MHAAVLQSNACGATKIPGSSIFHEASLIFSIYHLPVFILPFVYRTEIVLVRAYNAVIYRFRASITGNNQIGPAVGTQYRPDLPHDNFLTRI